MMPNYMDAYACFAQSHTFYFKVVLMKTLMRPMNLVKDTITEEAVVTTTLPSISLSSCNAQHNGR